MTLHLTRDEWERIAAAGAGVLFRPGEYDARYRAMGVRTPSNMRHPPAEFVEAAAACEHLYATAPRYSGGNYGHHGTRTCPDCGAIKDDWSPWSNGKRRVSVVVPCGHQGGVVVSTVYGNPGWSKNRTTCLKCNLSDGLVTVGHVVVEWGPLVVASYEWDPKERTYWVRPSNGRAFRYPSNPGCYVGQYALGVEVAT